MVPRLRLALAARRAAGGCEDADVAGSEASSLEWLDVLQGPAVQPQPGATVAPVFPLSCIEWPSTKAQLNIIDPAYRKMYDDIILSGARRFVVPYTKSLPGGRVRYAEMPPEDRRLFVVGSLLYLEDLREVSEETGGRVKYIVTHSVKGRARLKRLLNPAALFETDEAGNKIDYLRAEVEFLDDDEDLTAASSSGEEGGPSSFSSAEAGLRDQLAAAWEQLQLVSQGTHEPRFRSEFIREVVPRSTTWELASAWQEVQMAVSAHRQRAQVLSQASDWIKSQQERGKLPANLPSQLDVGSMGLPESILRGLSAPPEFSSEFWTPLLRVLAAGGPDERLRILLRNARDAVQLTTARLSLRSLLDEDE